MTGKWHVGQNHCVLPWERGFDHKLNPAGSAQSDVFRGQSWAMLENTPFCRYRHFNCEGGIATPLIVHWPARIAGSGELRHQPGHLVDIMATCVDVAGAKYAADFNGKPIQAREGKSFVPAFDDQPIQRKAIFWDHEVNARRPEDRAAGARRPLGALRFEADRTELHDLAAEKPEMVKQLAAKWEAWAERAHVKPYPEAAAKKAGKAKSRSKKR